MSRLSFNKKIILWFLCALFILFIDAGIVYKNFSRLDEQKGWVDHTYQVISTLNDIMSEVKDIEAAQRGYVITGDNSYLAPYVTNLPKLRDHLSVLASLIVDNPQQVPRAQLLKTHAESRLAIGEAVVKAYQKGGQQRAFALIKSGTGRQEMGETKSLVRDMTEEEQSLLAIRQSAVSDASHMALIWGGIGLGISTFILAFVFFLVRKETLQRQKLEEDLLKTLTEMKKSAEADAMISGMVNFLQSCRSMEEAYQILSKTLPRLLPETRGGVFIFNNSKNLLEQTCSWGNASGIEREFAPDQCWALRSGHIHVMQPKGAEPVCEHVHDLSRGGAVCFPMQAHGDTLGVFLIEGMIGGDVYKIICDIGEQIALAISNLKLQQRLLNQSIRDPLTGLFNRRYFEETIEREFSRARREKQPVSILALDIDHFKKFNDTMGHEAGDAVLVQFAKILNASVRKEDVASRSGGEEFIVLLPKTTAEMAQQRGKRICEATRAMQNEKDKKSFGTVTVSIGVATFSADGESPKQVISRADKALYEAKNNGRDQVRLAVGSI